MKDNLIMLKPPLQKEGTDKHTHLNVVYDSSVEMPTYKGSKVYSQNAGEIPL